MNKSFYIVLGLLLFMIYWIGELYQPFIQNIVISALLAVATYNIYDYALLKTKRRVFSAFITTLMAAVAVFFPFLYLLSALTTHLQSIDSGQLNMMISGITDWIKNLPEIFPELMPTPEQVAKQIKDARIIENSLNLLAQFGKGGAIFFKDLFMILIFYFFSLLYGKSILEFMSEVVPIANESARELYLEVSSVMSVVFYSIFAIAVLEGILFGVIVAVFGYDGILLGILYGFSSLIPVVGGVIMWIPVCGYEVFSGSVTNALVILIYSIVVISFFADTIVKPLLITYINKKIVRSPSHVNELLIFFAIIAGLATFGFWGMILGPAITTLFISLLRLAGKLSQAEEKIESLS